MSIYINQNIFWFDISVNDVLIVKIFHSQYELTEVKLGLIFGKFLDFAKVEKHLTTCANIHNKKELSFGLE
jgi:hypothetical protein